MKKIYIPPYLMLEEIEGGPLLSASGSNSLTTITTDYGQSPGAEYESGDSNDGSVTICNNGGGSNGGNPAFITTDDGNPD